MNDSIQEKVAGLFGTGQLYCAETAVQLLAEAGGHDATQAVRMATGFCSGGARTSGQCGAVSGTIMGIGLYAGRTEPGGDYEACYALVQDFVDRFTAECGSINCTTLCGCDLSKPEGGARFKEEQVVTRCIGLVTLAVETALELLRENGYITEGE